MLVIAEDWCGDVIDNLPILGRLAEASGKLNCGSSCATRTSTSWISILNQGEFRSIPVFVFFDDEFNELGRFIERPESVTHGATRSGARVFAEHPEFGLPDTPIAQMPEEARTQLMS